MLRFWDRVVALLTNNPLKIDGLRAEGIDVTKRISIVTGVNEVNEEYHRQKGPDGAYAERAARV